MYIDIALGLCLILGFLYGYSKGIIKTLFSILSILLGIVAAMKLSPLTINAFNTMLPNNPRLAYIVGFLATFILVIVLIRFIGNRLESLFKVAKINFVNKLVGGTITAFFFLVIFSSVIWFLNEARLLGESQKDQSISYYLVEPIPSRVKNELQVIQPIFQDFWNKTLEVFDKARQEGEQWQVENN